MNNYTFSADYLTARDLQSLLHISRSNAYNLMHRADFPTTHIGHCLRVSRDDLDHWLEKQKHTNKNAI